MIYRQGKTTIARIGFVHDPSLKTQGYLEIAAVRSDKQKARDVLVAELQRVQSSLRRCLAIASALGLVVPVERLLTQTEGLVALVAMSGDELGEALAA